MTYLDRQTICLPVASQQLAQAHQFMWSIQAFSVQRCDSRCFSLDGATVGRQGVTLGDDKGNCVLFHLLSSPFTAGHGQQRTHLLLPFHPITFMPCSSLTTLRFPSPFFLTSRPAYYSSVKRLDRGRLVVILFLFLPVGKQSLFSVFRDIDTYTDSVAQLNPRGNCEHRWRRLASLDCIIFQEEIEISLTYYAETEAGSQA